jgi:hypothetical protein
MRFSIRDLLWATVVVAMGLGWWNEHRLKRSEAIRRCRTRPRLETRVGNRRKHIALILAVF